MHAPLQMPHAHLSSLVLRTALLASLSLGSTTIAAPAIASALPGSSKAATGVASRPTSLDYTVSVRADLRGRAALRPSSLDGHPSRRDGRCARHPRVDRPATHAGDGRSSPTLASASGCSLAGTAAPTRRKLRLQLGSHLRRDRHGAHACPARGPRASPRATPARARPTPTGVRAARATARPPGLHRRINPTARGCDSTSIAASVLASCPGPRMNGGPMVACDAPHRVIWRRGMGGNSVRSTVVRRRRRWEVQRSAADRVNPPRCSPLTLMSTPLPACCRSASRIASVGRPNT